MSRRRRHSGREGESILLSLLFLGYLAYQKLLEHPFESSLILGAIAALLVIAILLISRAWRIRKANLLMRDSFVRDYTPYQFEKLTAEIFRQLGFKAHVTPSSGDKGIDVILERGAEKFGVQCKRYLEPVGPAYIREFVGALDGARIPKGIFVTSSTYTLAAIEAAKNSRTPLFLIDGEKLGEYRNKAERRINTDLIPKPWWHGLPGAIKGLVLILLMAMILVVTTLSSYSLITLLSQPEALSGSVTLQSESATRMLETSPTVDLIVELGQTTATVDTSQTTQDWSWGNLELYQMDIELPQGWYINEINRRPEPTDPGTEGCRRLSHDCADYRIVSSDQQQSILIMMPCGFDDGTGGPCGPSCVIISQLGSENLLVRDIFTDMNEVKYLAGGYVTISDQGGTREEFYCSDPFHITFKDDSRPVSSISDFTIPDRIVLSVLPQLINFCNTP